MPDPTLEQRIDRLDTAMAELARESAATERDWRRHRAEMRRMSAEWQARHDAAMAEDRRQHAEWQARHDATVAEDRRQHEEWKQRWDAAIAEARRQDEEWKKQWEASVADAKRQDAEWKQQWDAAAKEFRLEMRRESGELSRRLGTMAEDLVAPSVGRILRTFIAATEADVSSVAVRVRRGSPQRPGEMIELDVVAVCGDYVLANETKGRLAPEHIPAFVERLGSVREFFPEYAGKRILGAIASLYVDESLVRLGERHGLIVLGFGEDLMDVLNTPGFVPREF